MNEAIMFQVSTLQALLMGYSRPVIDVAELLVHGDTGLGTFEDVDGEMIMLDGHCYRAKNDGTVVEAEPSTGVPFASVTFLKEGSRFPLADITDMETLKTQLDLKVEEDFGLNSMHVVRVDGKFRKVDARSETAHRSQHVPLKEILEKTQEDFFFEDLKGSLVCVYYPDYMDGINAPGWHFHFVSEDRTRGGHVFGMNLEEGEAHLLKIQRIEIQLPRDAAFDTYTLSEDMMEDMKKVEQKSSE